MTKVVTTKTITQEMITSSTFNDADPTPVDWDSITTYAADDQVLTPSTQAIYTSAQGSNLNNNPLTDDGTWWVLAGYSRFWKPFDGVLQQQTSDSASIEYVIAPGVDTTVIAFLNVDADEIVVEVDIDGGTGEDPGEPAYTVTIDLVNNAVADDWWEYFYAPVERVKNAVLEFSGMTSDGFITVTLARSGGVAIGEIVTGSYTDLGTAAGPATLEIDDYSTKTTDDFGNVTVVERAYRDKATVGTAVLNTDIAATKRLLSSRRAAPTLYYVGDEQWLSGAIVYGFYEDFRLSLRGGTSNISSLELTMEGLV